MITIENPTWFIRDINDTSIYTEWINEFDRQATEGYYKLEPYNPFKSGQRLFIIKPPRFIKHTLLTKIVSNLNRIKLEFIERIYDKLFSDPLIYIRYPWFKYFIRMHIRNNQTNGKFDKIDKYTMDILYKKETDNLQFCLDVESSSKLFKLYGTSILGGHKSIEQLIYNNLLRNHYCYINQYRLKIL